MNNNKSIYLAQELINCLGVGASVSDGTEKCLKKICGKRSVYEAKKDIYFYAAEIISNIDSQEARIIAFNAYKNLPTAYRSYAIDKGYEIILNARNNKEAAEYKYWVGLLLYDSNRLSEAEQLLRESYKFKPSSYLACRWLAEVHVKLNNIDEALNLLYDYRNGPYFKPVITPSVFGDIVDNTPVSYITYTIKETENKKARGYVYRSRRKIT